MAATVDVPYPIVVSGWNVRADLAGRAILCPELVLMLLCSTMVAVERRIRENLVARKTPVRGRRLTRHLTLSATCNCARDTTLLSKRNNPDTTCFSFLALLRHSSVDHPNSLASTKPVFF